MGWLNSVLHFLSLLDAKDFGLLMIAIGYGVAHGYLPALWERLVPPRRSRGPLSDGRKEQIKIRATYFNTVGAGFMVTGVVGPGATYFYGTMPHTENPGWELLGVGSALIGISLGLHFLARAALRGLDT